MPIYEFKCGECGKVIEAIIGPGAKKLRCDCGGTAKKIISAPARPQFKGSGFYETDYKRKGGSEA